MRVAHEYAPVSGNVRAIGDSLESFAKRYPDACLDAQTVKRVRRELASHGSVGMESVQYILTTANTWKKPIRDFELRVEPDGRIATFCWDGKVQRTGATLVARARDFEPRRELTVYFIRRDGGRR